MPQGSQARAPKRPDLLVSTMVMATTPARTATATAPNSGAIDVPTISSDCEKAGTGTVSMTVSSSSDSHEVPAYDPSMRTVKHSASVSMSTLSSSTSNISSSVLLSSNVSELFSSLAVTLPTHAGTPPLWWRIL